MKATLAANAVIAAANKAAEKLLVNNIRAAQRIVQAKTKADEEKRNAEIEKVRVASLVGEDKAEYDRLAQQIKLAAKEKEWRQWLQRN